MRSSARHVHHSSKSSAITRKSQKSVGKLRRLPAFGFDTAATPAAPSKGALCIPVNYALPGVFPARKQPSAAGAWATQVTLLLSWRDDKPYTEEQALAVIGEQWVDRFARGEPLNDDETAMLIGALGACTPPPQLLSSEAWAAVLRLYGPAAIIEGDAGGARFPTKGRIVIGIGGDGDPSGTRLEIIDTTTGAPAKLTLQQLGGPYRLLHWHADAGLGAGARPTAPVVVDSGKSPSAPPAGAVDSKTNGNGAGAPATNGHGAHAGHDTPPSQASWRGVRSASRYAYARDVPTWDLPSNFPAEIRAFWADRNARMHHYIWHLARSQWPELPEAQKNEIRALGFSDPPRLAGSRRRSASPGAGVDFLNMHRQMVATTHAIAVSLGGSYRNTGWSPIPWSHSDPVWPMPTWSWGSTTPEWKKRETTAYWQKMAAQLRDPTWLASISLDALGTTLEEGIHNWFHMHWATQDPANPSDTSPSADFLGSTFSSQVNPIFWKLHGWIDECIELWETAPVTAGTGAKRNAATELARFNWLGPVPRPPAKAGSKSFSAHDHGSINLSEQEVQDLFARLQTPEPWEFPFAELPKSELVARFGDVGEITIAQLEEIGPADSSSVAVMASVRRSRQAQRGRRYVPVGYERHGVRQMDIIDDIKDKVIDFGRSIFKKITSRPEEGRFAVKSDVGEIMNADTPAIAPWTRTTAIFTFKATTPDVELKDAARGDILGGGATLTFRLMLSFEHNGFDLREARVLRQIQGSSEMDRGNFEINFTAKNATNKESEIARIDFLISGKWDPGLGDKFFDFSGKLTVEADGDMFLQLDPVDRVSIDSSSGGNFTDVQRTALTPPTVITKRLTVFFKVDKDEIEEGEMQRIKDWVRELQAEEIRFRRLRDGTTTIFVEGHASSTGKGQHNQDLSRKRALKVVSFLKDEVGSKADIQHAAKGEPNPEEKVEVEEKNERRADVWFEIPQ